MCGKRSNNESDLNYHRDGFSSLRGGSPSVTVNICPNMAARVNTGRGGGSFDQAVSHVAIFNKMRAFNGRFIISLSGEKNSEREPEMTWTERERAPG